MDDYIEGVTVAKLANIVATNRRVIVYNVKMAQKNASGNMKNIVTWFSVVRGGLERLRRWRDMLMIQEPHSGKQRQHN